MAPEINRAKDSSDDRIRGSKTPASGAKEEAAARLDQLWKDCVKEKDPKEHRRKFDKWMKEHLAFQQSGLNSTQSNR